MIGQMDIIVSDQALKESNQRLFPASKNRSARIRKKLIKRFGGEFHKVPCIYRMGDKFVMHPERYAAFQSEVAAKMREKSDAAFYRTMANPW